MVKRLVPNCTWRALTGATVWAKFSKSITHVAQERLQSEMLLECTTPKSKSGLAVQVRTVGRPLVQDNEPHNTVLNTLKSGLTATVKSS